MAATLPKPTFSWLKIAGLAALLAGSATTARAGGMAPDLSQKVQANPNSAQSIRVIVQFARPGVDSDAIAKGHRGQVNSKHGLINGATLTLPQNAAAELAQDPNVTWVSPDRPLGAQWDCGAQTIGADQVWLSPGCQGSGIGVAVLGTGVPVKGVSDFSYGSRVTAWQDFVQGWYKPYGDNGHGTHVSGIILGNGSTSHGLFSGIAPAAQLIAVKVLDQNGCGSVSTVINCLNWCVQNENQYNIRVINLRAASASA
jgi:serine protease AprX